MTSEQRRKVIAAIHAAAARVFQDDEDRRAFMDNRTGKRSCSEMTGAELGLVLDWINYLGGLRSDRPPMRVDGATASQVDELERLRGFPPRGFAVSPLTSPDWIARTLGREPPLGPDGRVHFEMLDRGEATRLLAAWSACNRSGERAAGRGHHRRDVRAGRDSRHG